MASSPSSDGEGKAPSTRALRARARLLAFPGEQLIDNARCAILESVKNGYDADTDHAVLPLDVPDRTDGTIAMTDAFEIASHSRALDPRPATLKFG